MRRYMARAHWCEELGKEVFEPGPVTVYEPDDEPVWTGLYDINGARIYSVADRQPMGFIR